MRLKGKVAIITGGGQGLGKAYCLRLIEEGCKVVIAEINFEAAKELERKIIDKGGEALSIKTDVSSEESTKRMAEKTIKRFGRIDILINNAAIFPITPWMEIGVEEWDKVLAVNLKGCFLCAKAVFPQMKKQGKGKIINISSGNFFHGIPSFFLHYAASKAGIIGFTSHHYILFWL